MFAARRLARPTAPARATRLEAPPASEPAPRKAGAAVARSWGGQSSFESVPAKTKVTVHGVGGASSAEADKVREAAGLMERVLGSRQFHDAVLAQTGMINTQGLTCEQIYQRILAGSEGATPGADHEADLEVSLYNKWNRWSKEVAWSGANEPAIHFNRKFFSRFEASDVAGTLSHEWCHQLGFNDSGANTNSVPYRVGEIVSRLAENPEALTPLDGAAPADPPVEVPATPAHATLKRGAQGPEVESLQRLLKSAGFSPGPVDGDFGRYTEKALQAFQRSQGLSATGVADEASWAALEVAAR